MTAGNCSVSTQTCFQILVSQLPRILENFSVGWIMVRSLPVFFLFSFDIFIPSCNGANNNSSGRSSSSSRPFHPQYLLKTYPNLTSLMSWRLMIFSNKTRICLQKVTLRVPYDIKDHFGVLKCKNRFNVKKNMNGNHLSSS